MHKVGQNARVFTTSLERPTQMITITGNDALIGDVEMNVTNTEINTGVYTGFYGDVSMFNSNFVVPNEDFFEVTADEDLINQTFLSTLF